VPHRIISRWPIRVGVAASGVVVALLVSLFLGWYAPAQYSDDAMRAKREQVAGTAEMVALSVSVGLRLNVPSTVAGAINWARRDSALTYLAVLDTTGRTFASFNPDSLSFDIVSFAAHDTVDEHDGLLFASAPIRFGGESLGQLVMGTSLVPLRARIAEQRRLGLGVSFGVLSVGVLLSLYLANCITRPIVLLRRASEAVAAGSYDIQLRSTSKNEIGALANAFSAMVEKIRTQLLTMEGQARELEATRDTAVEATRAKTAFLAMMSHEIRTPMNGVLGMLDLLRSDNLTSEQRDFAELAYRSGESLLAILNDILDTSKIEANKLDLEEIDFDLDETLDEVIQLVGERAASKGLELICVVRHDVPLALRSDPGRLRQVLVNLAGNAVKFTHDGEVVITVSLVSAHADEVELRFEVRDSGIGLSPDDQARLFQPFSQADGSTTRRYGGTGLGLSISRQLVSLMGGVIGVRSAPDLGSTFEFTARFRRKPGSPSAPASGALASANLLVVDGHRTSRRGLQILLGSHGASCLTAASAAEAATVAHRARARGTTFDLAVIDARLTGSDAVVLARQVRESTGLPGSRIILLGSLQDRAAFRENCLRHGYAFLHKPIARRQLLARCSGILTPVAATIALPPPVPGSPSPTGPGDFAGGRILVAEDNPVNERVVREFLRRLNIEPTVVPNGALAVEAVRRESWALVLMDCHMPVMDGFQATAAIRALGFTSDRLPVIALTASAMADDRTRCLEAGMDDFLTKPLRSEALTSVLTRWMRPGSRPAAAAPIPTPLATRDESQVLDINQLASLVGSDPVKIREFVTLFFTSTAPLLSEIDQAHDARNGQALQRASHSLKGSAASMGIIEVAAVAQVLEKAARENDWHVASRAHEELPDAYERARTSFEEFLSEYAVV
jgi:signal transduction histidine kinase/DNA-binding response OmpR family regulator